MDPASLPTKADFLAKHLEAMECDISKEPFTASHVPTRISGPGKCQHIFGSTCLTAWMDSKSDASNACPMCREVLFTKPPPAPVFVAGERPDIRGYHLESITVPAQAWMFINALRITMSSFAQQWAAAQHEIIYDSDLEHAIMTAVSTVRINHWERFEGGLWVRAHSMPGEREVAKDMMMKPLEDGSEKYTLIRGDRVTNAEWLDKVQDVVKWKLEE